MVAAVAEEKGRFGGESLRVEINNPQTMSAGEAVRIVSLGGPSGTGKDTLMMSILRGCGGGFLFIPRVTTRPKRKAEADEVDYFFVSNEEFDELESRGELIHPCGYVTGSRYALPGNRIRKALEGGADKTVLLIGGVCGTELQSFFPDVRILTVYLVVKDLMVLHARMKARGDNEIEIQKRIINARKEIEAERSLSDIVIWNEQGNLPNAAAFLLSLLKS